MTHPTAAVVLAAGRSKRMRSKTSKVLHQLSGRPMIDHVLDALRAAGVERTIVVTGHDEENVKAHLGERAETVTQSTPRGTGHAVMQAEPILRDHRGLVVVACGDAPLWRPDTIRGAISMVTEPGISGVVLSTRLDDPTGYGRVIRGPGGEVRKIVEQRDASELEARVCEVNSGTYVFHAADLFQSLSSVTDQNAQGEYYLTDVIEILIRQGRRVLASVVEDSTEAFGINSRIELARAEEALQRRTLQRLLETGVTVIDPKSTWVDSRVEIGQDTILYPNSVIRGCTVVGEECRIGPNTELIDAVIGDGAVIRHSVIERHEVGPDTVIGPFATLVGGAGRARANGSRAAAVNSLP